MNTAEPRDRRVLILAPTGKDAVLTREILTKAGIEAVVCHDLEHLCGEVAEGVGALLIAEEALQDSSRQPLVELVDAQGPWSDLPILALTHPGADSSIVSASVLSLGNVTLIERPVRVVTLVSAVRGALRARERQYDLRDHYATQALLAAIVSNSDDAIVSKTLEDGVILSWNAGAERIFGWTAEEAVGKPIALILPPDRRDEERGILQRLTRGERLEHFQTVRITKDGRLIDVSLTISPVRDSTGRIVAASKVARDITAQRRAEQALRESDRRKDEFLAMLAHELRNPLAPIRNALQILKLAGGGASGVERVREMMERQVNHMVRLVDDLMEVSRITRGKIDVRKERVALADLVQSAIETSQPLIESAGHRLTVSLPLEPVVLEADPVRVAQVFANLLNNAAKYADEPGQIWLTARRDDGQVVVSVRDTGVGIAPEMLPQVFEMFTQVGDPRRRSQAGLGIGLTLVRSLVQMHGGSVTAHSEGLGRGSEFVVRLPLARDASVEAKPAAGTPSGRHPLRVLVVDDNRDAAESLGMLLQFLGAEIEVVHDGTAALAATERFRPDLVLLDLGMPGMDGYEVARRIRQRPELAEVTLIALTGWGQDEDRRRSRLAGFDHHLIKPTDMDALQALMATVGKRQSAPQS